MTATIKRVGRSWATVAVLVLALVASTMGVAGADPPSTQIYRGSDVPDGKYPFMAEIQSGGEFNCGGSLIGDRWVLTAAHCVEGQDVATLTAVVGRLDRTDTKVGEAHRILYAAVHPRYLTRPGQMPHPGELMDYDVAVLKLDRAVTTGTPIRLATADQESYQEDNSPATVLGWGRMSDDQFSDRLQEADMRVVSKQTCSNHWGSILTEPAVCAEGYGDGGQTTCHGDSGGPLIAMTPDGPIQIGIISGGAGQPPPYEWRCDPSHPSILMDVNDESVQSFIQDAIRGAGNDLFVPAGGEPGAIAGLQLTNPGPVLTTAIVHYTDESGFTVRRNGPFELAVGESKTLFDETGFDRQFKGSIWVEVENPGARLQAMANVVSSEGKPPVDGSSAVQGGAHRVLVPLLQHGNAGTTSEVVVQNTEAKATTVILDYRDTTGLAARQTVPLRPHGSITLRQDLDGQPTTFGGLVTSDTRIAVTVLQRAAGQRLSYTGFDDGADPATELSAPLMMAGNYGSFTGLQVENVSNDEANVTVTYGPNTATGSGLCGSGVTGWIPEARTLPVYGKESRTWLQHKLGGKDGWSALDRSGSDPQFDNCRYVGAARVTSTSALVMVVNQASFWDRPNASATEGFPIRRGTPEVQVPLVNVNNADTTTGVQVQNVGNSATRVTIEFSGNNLSAVAGRPCPGKPSRVNKRLGPDESYTRVLPNDDTSLADCAYVGSATITSDPPGKLAVVVNSLNRWYGGDGLGTTTLIPPPPG